MSSYTEGEAKALLAPLFDMQPEDIDMYVILLVDRDQDARIRASDPVLGNLLQGVSSRILNDDAPVE